MFLVFTLPLVSSSIFIEPLKPIYNHGDQINVQTKIVPSVATSSHYIVDLKCGTDFTTNIFNSFFDIQAGIEKNVLVTTELLNPLLDNITSQCYLKASFANDFTQSSLFDLSKEIIIDAEVEFENLNPGNSFHISGTALKKSGVTVNGFAELFIPSLNLYKSSIVSNGLFNLTLSLPQDVKSGDHNFSIEIHNTDYNSRKINSGVYEDTFSVNQILKNIKIQIPEDNVIPGSEFVFRVNAYDQARDLIKKDVSLVVNKPKGIPFIKKVIKSGEDQKLEFALDDISGYWSIEANVEGVSERKLFYLLEVNNLQSSLINDTLIVTNIGNSIYSGPFEITIGSFVEVKHLNLKPGETQKFNLKAPDGDYSISILENEGIKNLGSVFLTGNAVKVTDFKEDVIYTFTNPWIWWLGVILLVLIIVLVQIKLRMQKNQPKIPLASNNMLSNLNLKASKSDFVVGSNLPEKSNFSSNNSSGSNKFDVSWLNRSKPVSSTFNSGISGLTSSTQSYKVSPSVLFGNENKGIRERAVAIALYVSSNSAAANETMSRSLHIAQEVGAKVYVDGEYKIILLSPRLTHTSDNEVSAINVARRIQASFLEHMRMYNDGVVFGLGVSDGEIISEIENGKFHFTSTGNLISYSKRLAHVSNSKLLVSDNIRKKVMSTVKVEKAPYQGVWEVVKVTDRSSNEFIKRFSERNK